MINGKKLLVAMNFMSHAITAYPTRNATRVAPKVWIKVYGALLSPSLIAPLSSYKPLPKTAGTASRNE